MTDLWISGMLISVVVWAFVCVAGVIRRAEAETPLQQRDAARWLLRAILGLVLVPLWPIAGPVLIVKALLRLVREADLDDVHARDYAPDNDV